MQPTAQAVGGQKERCTSSEGAKEDSGSDCGPIIPGCRTAEAAVPTRSILRPEDDGPETIVT